MGTSSAPIEIIIDDESIAGTFLSPQAKVPGILFVHGWGGSQERDLDRARGIAGLGCVCLTFDLRGHERGSDRQKTVTREENLHDIIAAYDRLRSEEHTSELQSLMRISYAVFCLKKKKIKYHHVQCDMKNTK